MDVDLTPFGFTPTESRVYATLVRLGPSTGYQVGRGARLARANAYAALEGLAQGGAAARGTERPRRYRATDPTTLLAHLAARQGEALERLGRSLEGTTLPPEPDLHRLRGSRAVANVVTQLVARAERAVRGVVAAPLWAPTLPAWRRAATRVDLAVWVAGELSGASDLVRATLPADQSTLLVIDETHVVTAEGTDGATVGVWTVHPLLARVALRALEGLE